MASRAPLAAALLLLALARAAPAPGLGDVVRDVLRASEEPVEELGVTLSREAAMRLPDGVIYDPRAGLTREEWHWQDVEDADAPLRVVRMGEREATDDELLRALGVHVPGDELREGALTRQGEVDGDVDVVRQSGNTVRVAGSQSTLQVTYSSVTPDVAKVPFERALRTWADTFPCAVVIRIMFEWKEISGGTLGATTTPFFIPGSRRDAPNLDPSTMYGSVMAASLEGKDFISESDFHIKMSFNSLASWHFGENATPQELWDLQTTALHEQCHGLFFSGVIQASAEQQVAGFTSNANLPGRYDVFLRASDGAGLAEVCNRDGNNFFNAVTNNGLRFTDPESPGTDFGLYSPAGYQPGSSTYHHDPDRIDIDCSNNEISAGDCSDLMTQRLPNGYTQRNIGEPVRRVMAAMRGSSGGVGGGSGNCSVPAGVPGSDDRANGGADSASGEPFSLPRWTFITIAAVGGVGAVAIVYALISSFMRSR